LLDGGEADPELESGIPQLQHLFPRACGRRACGFYFSRHRNKILPFELVAVNSFYVRFMTHKATLSMLNSTAET
jgi:hypothetical protein